MSVCMFVHLCIRTVDTLEPNQLHIRNQYDMKVCHWPFIFPKSDQWLNYRRKGYAGNAFLWENFVL
jgi:hypothetical protein